MQMPLLVGVQLTDTPEARRRKPPNTRHPIA